MMDKFIINENAQANGVYEVHNASKACEHLPKAENQNLLGFFATSELAIKRAKMNWPREKIKDVFAVVKKLIAFNHHQGYLPFHLYVVELHNIKRDRVYTYSIEIYILNVNCLKSR